MTAPAPTTIGPLDPVDLHLHTVASDGAWTVDGLIGYLAEHGFKVVAVCDHDSQRSVAEAIRLGVERGVTVLPGVEMTTWWADRQWHLLVYGIAPGRTDEAAADWNACLAEIDATLQERAADARDRYEAAGYALPSLEEIRAGRPLWPFHVLSALIKDGHKPNLKEAAERLVELGGNFTADLPLERVVTAAHAAGGLCVVAHPGRSDSVGVMNESDLDAMLESIPVDGLEAHYRSYTDAQTALYRRMARDHGLLISCGSDSHAPGQPVDPRPWRAAWCRDLLERLGVEVGTDDPGPVWTEGMDTLAAVEKPAEPETPADADTTTDATAMSDAASTSAGTTATPTAEVMATDATATMEATASLDATDDASGAVDATEDGRSGGPPRPPSQAALADADNAAAQGDPT